MIDLVPVESSRLAAIGYDETSFTLAIKFRPSKRSPQGATYQYENVAPEEWDEFHAADSKGQWFDQNIKNNPDHPYNRVDEGKDPALAVQAAGEQPTSSVYLEAVPVPEPTELPEDEDGLKTRALEVQQKAQGLIIRTVAEFTQAGNELKAVVAEKKKAQDRVNQIKKPAYQTYQAALQLEKDVISHYLQAEKVLRQGIAQYIKQEEEERKRQEAAIDAERKRQAAEEANTKAIALAEHDAQVMEAQGFVEEAAQVRANPLPLVPAYVPPTVLQKETPKVEGVSSRKNWTFRIICEADIPREYLMPNEAAIRQVVKALKDKANIPGIQVYSEDSVTVRA